MLAFHTRVRQISIGARFAFRAAALQTLAGEQGTERWERLFFGDPLYEGGAAGARTLPTFVSNHDAGRFSMFVRRAFPKASDSEILARVSLGHAMMLTLRGVPTIYSGDEQGFVSDDGDQGARESMFPSRVASYNDNKLLGSKATTAQANFNAAHPLYRLVCGPRQGTRLDPGASSRAPVTRSLGQKAWPVRRVALRSNFGQGSALAVQHLGRADHRQCDGGKQSAHLRHLGLVKAPRRPARRQCEDQPSAIRHAVCAAR